jgi:methionine biosynthesis protein MetW
VTKVAPRKSDSLRSDLKVVADMVATEARVLDVGCGDGALLEYLIRRKRVDGRGIELSQAGVNACVTQGLSVVQGDADTDLGYYPEGAFDYVVLSQTLQATHKPRSVLLELQRISRFAIVSFPNFGHWQCRWQLLRRGRMPVTDSLTEPWYETANIHLCTITDFFALCRDLGISVDRAVALRRDGSAKTVGNNMRIANFFGAQAVFLLS